MEPLKIEATKITPHILFDTGANLLSIRGDSYPENAIKFYHPLISALEGHLKNAPAAPWQVDIEIAYFNSSSSKILMDLFYLFEEATGEGWRVIVNWRYHVDNDIALEYGKEFQLDITSLEFNLVAFGA